MEIFLAEIAQNIIPYASLVATKATISASFNDEDYFIGNNNFNDNSGSMAMAS